MGQSGMDNPEKVGYIKHTTKTNN